MTSLWALLRQNPNYRYTALGLPIHHLVCRFPNFPVRCGIGLV